LRYITHAILPLSVNTVIAVNDVNDSASISPIMPLIRVLFERPEWSGHLNKTPPPVSEIDMDEIFDVIMQLISPTIVNKLKIDSSKIHK